MIQAQDLICFFGCIIAIGGNIRADGTEQNETQSKLHDSTEPPVFGQDRLSDLKIIDTLLRTYDRRATPTNKIGQPTEVGCELFIRSFGSISEKTMDYQVDLYLRQHWKDPRLNHDSIKEALDLNDPSLVKAIWKPEVYFPNAKEGEFQYVTVPNVLLRIKPNGRILYMLRLKMKFSCMMELYKYPLDNQICTMEIASFSKTTRELLLIWNSDIPVDLSSDLKMPQFTVMQVKTDNCEESSLIGNYSCLVAKFHLSRSVGFHMVQSYVPTILIVVISWVSFWMDVDSVPGRTTLGVTTLLTVSSKSAGLNAETPQVSYVKAIDVWMGTCTAFIFAALIEFTIINYLWRRQKINYSASTAFDVFDLQNLEKNDFPTTNGDNPSDQTSNVHPPSTVASSNRNIIMSKTQSNGRIEKGYSSARMGVKIDESCRILFPVNFFIFNIFYWTYYLYY